MTRSTLILTLCALVLSGCATQKQISHDIATAKADAEQHLAVLDDIIKGNVRNEGLIRGKKIDLSKGETLPAEFEMRAQVMFRDNLASIYNIGHHVWELTRIKVVYGRMSAPSAGGSDDTGAMLEGVHFLPFDGTVRELLDYGTRSTGTHWEYDEDANVIRIFKYKTRNFRVSTFTSTDTLSNSQGKNSNISTETEIVLSPVEDLEAGIESIVSQRGTYSFTPSMSLLSATDEPHVLDEIQALVDEYNQKAETQIAFKFDLYAIQIDESENYGVKFDGAWSGNDLSASYSAESNILETLISGGVSIINDDSPFSGTNAIVQAISSIGEVMRVASTSSLAQNYTPVTRHIGTEQSFITKIEQTITSDVGPTTTATAEKESDGVHLRLLPMVLSDREILVDINVSLTTLLDPTSFEFQDLFLQLVNKSTRDFSQRVKVRSGATVVISGFDSMEKATNKSGVGSASNWFLGGGDNARSSRIVLVALITPRIL